MSLEIKQDSGEQALGPTLPPAISEDPSVKVGAHGTEVKGTIDTLTATTAQATRISGQFSTSPANPVLPGAGVAPLSESRQSFMASFFGPSYLAVEQAIDNNILQSQNIAGFMAQKTDIQQMASGVQLAQEQASLDITEGNAESSEYQQMGNAEFGTAIVDVTQAGMGILNSVKTNYDADQKFNKNIGSAKNEQDRAGEDMESAQSQLDEAQTKLRTINNNAPVANAPAHAVAEDADNGALEEQAPAPAPVPNQDQIDAEQDVSDKTAAYNKAKGSYELKQRAAMDITEQKTKYIDHTLNLKNQVSNSLADATKNMINSTKDMNVAALKAYEGSIKAQKDALSGYQKATDDYQGHLKDTEKQTEDMFNQTIQAKQKVYDEGSRWRG